MPTSQPHLITGDLGRDRAAAYRAGRYDVTLGRWDDPRRDVPHIVGVFRSIVQARHRHPAVRAYAAGVARSLRELAVSDPPWSAAGGSRRA